MALLQAYWPQVEALPWTQNLRRGQCFVCTVGVTAASGLYATADIFLPGTASVEAVVLGIILSASAAALVVAGPETASLGGTAATGVNASLGGPAPVATVTYVNASTQPPKTLFLVNVPANTSTSLFTFYPIGLSAGNGIRFGLSTADVSLNATIFWMEGG